MGNRAASVGNLPEGARCIVCSDGDELRVPPGPEEPSPATPAGRGHLLWDRRTNYTTSQFMDRR